MFIVDEKRNSAGQGPILEADRALNGPLKTTLCHGDVNRSRATLEASGDAVKSAMSSRWWEEKRG